MITYVIKSPAHDLFAIKAFGNKDWAIELRIFTIGGAERGQPHRFAVDAYIGGDGNWQISPLNNRRVFDTQAEAECFAKTVTGF